MSTTKTPWGSYRVLLDQLNYKVKQLIIKPHARLSLKFHKHRSEYMAVVAGEPIIQLGDETKQMFPGMVCFIPEEKQHRVSNITDEPVIIVEIQFGEKCEEEDVVRLLDDYGRAAEYDTPLR
jgi:mannose-1-phosphate guanylyltransferase